jgi:hypothetical protein
MSGLGTFWTVTLVGPVILFIVIIYALLTQKRLSRRDKVQQDQAVNNLYGDPDGRSSPAGDARAVDAEVRAAAPQK